MTPGSRFRQALKEEKPLQVIGTICAYHALMAKRVGYRAIYLSGGAEYTFRVLDDTEG